MIGMIENIRRIAEIETGQAMPPANGKHKRQSEPPKGIPANAYSSLNIPEPTWIVPGLLCEGLTVFAGAFKLGKSWAALELCLSVGNGGRVFNGIRVQRRHAAYLALEDGPRRIKSRLEILSADQRLTIPEGVVVYHEWPRLDQGGLEHLEQILTKDPELKLIVIDVWQKIRPPKRNGADAYEVDYQVLSGLKRLADRFHAAIVVVHHTRKMESVDPFERIAGSVAIPGCADCSWVLIRGRNHNEGELHITGRDVEEQQLAMRFEDCLWVMEGDLSETRMTTGQRTILKALKESTIPLGPKEVHELTGLPLNTVKSVLVRMASYGEISKAGRGEYRVIGGGE